MKTESLSTASTPRSARSRAKTESYLAPGASTQKLIRAAALNHRQWFAAWAHHGGGEVRRDGLIRMVKPDEITVPFPRIASANADRVLDTLVAECRERRPQTACVWSLMPARPRDLGARLLARGFQWGWAPHWMAMDFRKVPEGAKPPPGVSITVDREGDWDVTDLPYYNRKRAGVFRALAQAHPGRAFEFAARIDGRVVGHSAMFLTTGKHGVAGIYNVGVLDQFRRKGIGRALMFAVCDHAKGLGCHYALLNSAASEFYASIGFDSLGWGQTWWLHRPGMEAPPPTAALASFIAALARGDLRSLRGTDPAALPPDLDSPLPNGMTPTGVAMCAPKPAPVVEWLVSMGSTLDLRDAWDLGWADRIPAILARRPELIDRPHGPWQKTPLHDAVYRGDVAFVRALLAHKPNLEIQDTEFHSTPLGWARHFHRTEIINLIEAHRSSNV